MYGDYKGGILDLTLRVGIYGASQLINKADGDSEGSSQKAEEWSFTNKDGSQHDPNKGKSSYRLGNHGLVDSNPYLTDKYNSEDAVWRLMNAVNAAGGFKSSSKSRDSGKDTRRIQLIVIGDSLLATNYFISKIDIHPVVKIIGFLIFGVPGAYLSLSGMGVFDIDALAEEMIDETIYVYPTGLYSETY